MPMGEEMKFSIVEGRRPGGCEALHPVLLIHEKYMLCGYKEQATRKLLGFEENERQEGKEATECAAEDPDVEKAYQRL